MFNQTLENLGLNNNQCFLTLRWMRVALMEIHQLDRLHRHELKIGRLILHDDIDKSFRMRLPYGDNVDYMLVSPKRSQTLQRRNLGMVAFRNRLSGKGIGYDFFGFCYNSPEVVADIHGLDNRVRGSMEKFIEEKETSKAGASMILAESEDD